MSIQRITALTDFSPGSDHALETALELARALGSGLKVLHCYAEVVGGRAPVGSAGVDPGLKDAALARMREQVDGLDTSDVELEFEAVPGLDPDAMLLSALRKDAPDLVVMGTHGRKGISHAILGSIAEKCVREAPCPVVTVKSRT